MNPAESKPWTVGQLRAELVGLPDDLLITVLVEDGPGGTFYGAQALVGAGYENADRDDPVITSFPFPLLTRFVPVEGQP